MKNILYCNYGFYDMRDTGRKYLLIKNLLKRIMGETHEIRGKTGRVFDG